MERAQRVQRPNVDPEAVRAAGRQGARAGRQGVPGINEAKDLVKEGQRASGNVYDRPLYWAGKLFFRSGGEDYVCSAQFISPRILLTAAHCVRDSETGQWNTDFLFALQYKDGEFSQLYDYECAATKKAWLAEGFEKYLHDYAVIRVDEPSRTGFFGTHWNWSGDYDSAVKIGYPGGVANGEVMQVETGPIQFIEGVVQMQHGNPADQGGSSGGAWIARYSDGESPEANYIISVESFGLDGEPGVDYGPYLTADFKDLWDHGESGC
ncbi:MAG: trypsin-like serine protease [Hyphomicrobiales bacterium]|nr:trypsin-like serine protease [Hyphomicrobiales bacterium]